MKRVLTGLAVAAVVAALAPGASAGGFAPCDPWDIQCMQNCGPQIDRSGKIPRVYTVNC
jgi:hypothetical protein